MNKYLVKIAYTNEDLHIYKGMLDSAWQKNQISRDNDVEGMGLKDSLGKSFTGRARVLGRSVAEGLGGAVTGTSLGLGVALGLAHMNPSKTYTLAGPALLGVAAGLAGGIHGAYASSRNQGAEALDELAAKKIADNLIVKEDGRYV